MNISQKLLIIANILDDNKRYAEADLVTRIAVVNNNNRVQSDLQNDWVKYYLKNAIKQHYATKNGWQYINNLQIDPAIRQELNKQFAVFAEQQKIKNINNLKNLKKTFQSPETSGETYSEYLKRINAPELIINNPITKINDKINKKMSKWNDNTMLPSASSSIVAVPTIYASGAGAAGAAAAGLYAIPGALFSGILISSQKDNQANYRMKALTSSGNNMVDVNVMRQLNKLADNYKNNPIRTEQLGDALLKNTKGQSAAGKQSNLTYWNQIKYQQKQKLGTLSAWDGVKGNINKLFYGEPE